MGAEQNHLCPTSSYGWPGPPTPTGQARVVLARTSVPPCFSVMAMPMVAPRLSPTGTLRGSYSVASTLGSHFAATSDCNFKAGTLAKVMVSGQLLPASAWLDRKSVV